MTDHNPLIFGKDTTERVVSVEVDGSNLVLFLEQSNGAIDIEYRSNRYWILSPKNYNDKFYPLKGNLYYKYMKTYSGYEEYRNASQNAKRADIYRIYDESEAALVSTGITLFKGMKVEDVSVLSFDIEATTLAHNESSKVLLISNTFRLKDAVIRRLFAYNDYPDEASMFDAWCDWVRELDPSIMLGHNIYSYDLPYMSFCADKAGTSLKLGRDKSDVRFNAYPSKFRKDGSQFYTYSKAHVYGRQLVDTMFLALRFDIGRKYESYGLKQIIKQEKLEIDGRQFYDVASIKDNYLDEIEWGKIRKYAEHDADDALALYDLMIAAYFYLTPSVPKTFEGILTSAPGSQINSLLVRSYLQDGHSIPKASDSAEFEGATSFGNPGIFKNVLKFDIASLYPSIIREYRVYDKDKDPNSNFLKMVDYFTIERLNDKKMAKETGDRYYKDLEQARKIIINSSYGMLGAPGLPFNSPANASFITKKGREILETGIKWAESKKFKIPNGDTDSISFCKEDMSEFSEEEQVNLLKDLNSMFPEKIHWEHDGIFSGVLIIRTKNYALWDGKKLKIKGSALKATNKEPALQELIREIITSLMGISNEPLVQLYNKYIHEIFNLKDISRWCTKKTITDKVLNPERTNEQKVLDAIDVTEVQEGDKIYTYFDTEGNLKLRDNFNRDHNVDKLLEKLYKTLQIFENVVDMTVFPNYKLKKHKVMLQTLLEKNM